MNNIFNHEGHEELNICLFPHGVSTPEFLRELRALGGESQ